MTFGFGCEGNLGCDMAKGEPSLFPEWLKVPTNIPGTTRVQVGSRNRPVLRAANYGSSLIEHDTSRISSLHEGSSKKYSRIPRNSNGKKPKYGDNYRVACQYQKQCDSSYQLTNSGSANNNLRDGNSLPLPYLSTSSHCIQKNDFEKNFPSISTVTRCGNSKSNQVNIWQDKLERPNSGRPSLGIPTLGGLTRGTTGCLISGSGSNGFVSALADVSTLGLLKNNNLSSPDHDSGILISSTVSSPAYTCGLNMAETLAQNILRAYTPHKLNSETQKLEELSREQSKLLIPLIRSTTKTMGPCSSQKLNTNSKLAPSGTKFQKYSTSSDQASSIHTPRIPEISKPIQAKNPMKAGNHGNDKFGVPNVSGSRRQEFSMVKNAVLESSIATRLKKNSGNTIAADEKKLGLQNRNEFFNGLRKKDAQNRLLVIGTKDEPTSSTGMKVNGLERKGSSVVKPVPHIQSNDLPDRILDKSGKADPLINKDNSKINGTGTVIYANAERSKSFSITWSEEEEVAFMKSLGWNPDDFVEPLTKEEINAFYQKHKAKLDAIRQRKQATVP